LSLKELPTLLKEEEDIGTAEQENASTPLSRFCYSDPPSYSLLYPLQVCSKLSVNQSDKAVESFFIEFQ